MPDALRSLGRVAAAEAWRLLRVQSRFPLEFFGSVGLLYGAFFALRAVAARWPVPLFDAGGDVVGQALVYALWMWSYGIVGGVQAQAASDLATGALEPLYAGPVPPTRLMAGRAAGFALQSGLAALGLVGVVCLWRPPASMAWGGVLAAVALAFVTATGVALALVGLVLVFRRVSVLMTPISIGLMAVMLSPADTLPSWADAVPWVVPRRLLADAVSGHLDGGRLGRGLLVATAVALAGAWLHGVLDRRARATGRLSLG